MIIQHRKHFKLRPGGWLAAAVAASLAAFAFAACGDNGGSSSGHMPGGEMDGAPSGAILVRLSNWSIDPAKSSSKAGNVTFRAVHDMHDMHADGEGKTHELVVARKNADGTFDVLAEAEEIGIGEHKDLTVRLAAGEYELQCNIIEEVNGKPISHYTKGMRTAFKVT